MKLVLRKPDVLGAFVSALCMVHCYITPFIFMVQASAGGSKTSPDWWNQLDYFFLVLSLFAVIRSTKKSSKVAVKMGIWFSWCSLFVLIINEKNGWISLPEMGIYIASSALVILHIYNLKYCQCETDSCCTKQ